MRSRYDVFCSAGKFWYCHVRLKLAQPYEWARSSLCKLVLNMHV